MIKEKMHQIAILSNEENLGSSHLLGSVILNKKLPEFSYIRNGSVQYCDLPTIKDYINFSVDLGILNRNYGLTINKPQILNLENFESWASDLVIGYITSHNFSIDQILLATNDLINNRKILPTTGKLFESLNPSTSRRKFVWSLIFLSDTRPSLIDVCRNWIWIPNRLYEY
jgi:hypothetical protein